MRRSSAERNRYSPCSENSSKSVRDKPKKRGSSLNKGERWRD